MTPDKQHQDKPPHASLPPTVIALGIVSLFNDSAGDMINPLLPAFIAAVGGGPEMLGVIEGIADATGSLLKLLSGYLADRIGHLKAVTMAGYTLAAIARPTLTIAGGWWQILAARFGDRCGKGVRGAPRDRLIAEATPREILGRAYGFHRAMDHAGGLVGPIVVYLMLRWGMSMRSVFAWTALPGALSIVILARWVKEDTNRRRPARIEIGIPRDPGYRRFLLAMFVFTLGGASDTFLLWRAHQVGIATVYAPLLWLVLAAVKTASSTWGGSLSDHFGRRAMIMAGWGLYAAVYLAFAFAARPWEIWALFTVYGLFYGLSEGAERALVVDLVSEEWRGRALGAYQAATGIALLPASLIFGFLYQQAGAEAAFIFGAAMAAIAAAIFPHTQRTGA